MWILATWTHLMHKYRRGIAFKDPDIVRTIFLVLWMLAEPMRLWSAYQGNLKEKVPWMAVSFLLTCFPQVPACIYLLIGQKGNQPVDRALNIVMASFIVPELFLFLSTMRRMIKVHQQQFYLHDFSHVANLTTLDLGSGKDHYSMACDQAFEQETGFRTKTRGTISTGRQEQ
ncbi:hypothetical protein BSKO_00743 [Bryopsis sp. KO-2023]|nr:hypothetical protein BSKO_00743 [Bryopsis sp. KO-2023]